jgi:hypothetical protein
MALSGGRADFVRLADGVGFEPTIPFWSIHTFQACAFDHSATRPLWTRERAGKRAPYSGNPGAFNLQMVNAAFSQNTFSKQQMLKPVAGPLGCAYHLRLE